MLIDGDLLKPAPMWLFSNSMCPEMARVLEFRLEGTQSSSEIRNSIDYLNALISNLSRCATECLVKRYNHKDKFDYIVLTTQDVSLINFNLSAEKRKELFDLGYEKTHEYFTKTLRAKKLEMVKYYKILYVFIKRLQDRIEQGKYQSLRNLVGELFIELTDIKKYIDYFNSHYAVVPASPDTFWLKAPDNLDDILCAQITRKTDYYGQFSFHSYKFAIEKQIYNNLKISFNGEQVVDENLVDNQCAPVNWDFILGIGINATKHFAIGANLVIGISDIYDDLYVDKEYWGFTPLDLNIGVKFFL